MATISINLAEHKDEVESAETMSDEMEDFVDAISAKDYGGALDALQLLEAKLPQFRAHLEQKK